MIERYLTIFENVMVLFLLGCAQRRGIYEVWALKNVRPVTEHILKTNFLAYLKQQLQPSPFAAAW